MAKIRPLQDRVLVKRLEEKEKTKGGIIIPDSAKEKPIMGEVVAVGGGKREEGRQDPVRQVLRDRRQDRRRGVPHHARRRHPRRDPEVTARQGSVGIL